MAKKKTSSKKTNKSKIKTNPQVLEEIIGDHAGEYGATRIYDGQIAVWKKLKYWKTIQNMANQEQELLINLMNLFLSIK